ncbi:patatin-like phospholipase family protein [Micromonospora sp. NBC_01796]|uniref:patatin-like phospholipase family protein n=1 Tax=Micromonospora sp. NBC_01796 TaxID=2975987 RepID=UPI002DD8227A|nr:patatin-like phospholipase family protein [Micromonospora sp. NBC_01796]WSA84131.1 patatin-like phospholipase family protein [Micromonospora sp. NBC_01796]
MPTDGRALVLGGGGVTGVAWEIGLLHGLAQCGVDLAGADTVIGTSAGAAVAAQLTGTTPLADIYAAQIDNVPGGIPARIGVGPVVRLLVASAWPGDRRHGRAWLGRAALRAKTMSEAERRAVVERRVPDRRWPDRRLLVTAVDAETGTDVVFDRDSGVTLIDAVAASCAVPLVWPPVTIDGRRYLDGGVRSVANVDLAAGHGRVVVIAPTTSALRRTDRPHVQAAALGVPNVVVTPDAAARAAIGPNMLDPARRAAAARAGRDQAESIADRIRAVWQ